MENVVSLQDVWQFLWRHRGRIAAATSVTAAASLLATFLLPPTYEATSLLLVKFGREYVYRPEVGEREVAPSRDRDTFINTELQILRSSDLARDVVRAVGIKSLYPGSIDQEAPNEPRIVSAASARLSKNLIVERMPESNVLRVAFRHSDAEMSAKALNRLVDKFKEKHLEAFSEPKAAVFLQEKVTQYREELTRVEEKLKALQIDSKSFSIDDQRIGLFQQRRDLDTSLKEARNQIAGLEEKLTYLRSEKEKASADKGRVSGDQNKAISDARAQLLELELQEQKLLATFSETSRQVVGVRKQIQLVKDFLERQKAAIGQGEFAEDIDRQIVAVLAELRFQQAKRDNVLGQVGQLEKELGRVPAQDAQYRNLIREREASEKNYESHVKKLEEARLSEDMDKEKIANISVIQAAAPPLAPVWPSRPLNLAVGVCLGVLLGIGWGFALDRFGEAAQAREATAREVALNGTLPRKLTQAGRNGG